jgi:hypothetical protein
MTSPYSAEVTSVVEIPTTVTIMDNTVTQVDVVEIGVVGPQGVQGVQGVQGTSGVINVTSPITNSGTSTSAQIGINQAALEIQATQITSGTLPVNRGGTGVTSVTSGSALIGNGTSAMTELPVTTNAPSSPAGIVAFDSFGNVRVTNQLYIGPLSSGTGTENITIPGATLTNVLKANPTLSGGSSTVTSYLPTTTGNLVSTGDNATVTDTMLAGSISPSKVTGLLATLVQDPDLLVVGSITRNSSNVVTTAAVVWPDGVSGTYTSLTFDSATGAVNSYQITKGAAIYTQPTLTRNSAGAVTNRPAIVVT